MREIGEAAKSAAAIAEGETNHTAAETES